MAGNSDTTADFPGLLRASIKVVGDFGAMLEKRYPEDGFGPLRSEQHLPHARETILYALGFLQAAISDDDMRTMIINTLTSQEVKLLFSGQYLKSLESCRSLLEMFVPDSALAAQRKLATDTVIILGQLGSDEQEKILEKLPPFALEVLAAARKSGE
jgi:hypothetical protein